MLLLNAFSLNMAGTIGTDPVLFSFQRIELEEARALLKGNVESRVGHEDSAQRLSGLLGFEVQMNRENTTIKDRAVIAQYIGPRLPEGTKTLPEGATIEWFLVKHYERS